MRKAAVAILLVLAVTLGGAAVFVATFDADRLRPLIEAQASGALGRPVVIAGPIEIERSLTPSLIVHGVRVPEEGAEPPLLLGRAEGSLDLRSLFGGTIRISRIEIADAALRLPLDLAESEEDDLSGLPQIDRIVLSNVRISWRAGDGHEIALDLRHARLDTGGERTVIDIEGTAAGQALHVSGTTGRLPALISGGAWPLELEGALGEARLAVAGSLGLPGPDRMPTFEGRLYLALPAPAEIAVLAGLEVPSLPPLTASARVRSAGDLVTIEQLAAALGRSELGGELTLQHGGPRPRLAGRLTGRLIDLTELLPAQGTGRAPPAVPDGRVIPDLRLPVVDLPFDLELAVEVERLDVPDRRLAAVAARVVADGSAFRLDPVRARLANASIAGRYEIEPGRRPAAVRLSLRADHLDLAALLPGQGDGGRLPEDLDLTIELAGRGENLRALLGSADGRIQMVTGEALIAQDYAGFLGRSVLTALLPATGRAQGLKVNCSVVRLEVAGGKARTRALVVDTEHATVGGSGGIDLRSETIDLLVLPKAKKATLAPLVAPVHASGTLAKPVIKPHAETILKESSVLLLGLINPIALVVPFVSLGTGDDNPCLTALDNPAPEQRKGVVETTADTATGAARAAGGVVEGAARGAGSVLRGVGEGASRLMKGLFGE